MQHNEIIMALDEIGRTRALTDSESRTLERAIRQEGVETRRAIVPAWYQPWNDSDDAKILKAAEARIRAIDIAETMGRTPWGIRTRLYALRKQASVQMRDAGKRIRAREQEA